MFRVRGLGVWRSLKKRAWASWFTNKASFTEDHIFSFFFIFGWNYTSWRSCAFNVLEQFLECWADVQALILVRTLGLHVNLFCRDMGLWTCGHVDQQRNVFFCTYSLWGQPLEWAWMAAGAEFVASLRLSSTQAFSDWNIKVLQVKAKNIIWKVLRFFCLHGLWRLRMWACNDFKAKLLQTVLL